MKKIFVMIIMCFVCTNFVYAGAWYNMPNSNYWFYIQDDNTFAINKWVVDNGKYYYFDNNGIMLSNTITPDGYTVGSDGAYLPTAQNNVINTKGIDITTSSDKKKDVKNSIISKKNVEFLDSVKIGTKTWANVIKFSGSDSNIKLNSGDYTRITFEAGIKEKRDDISYDLTIFVNGQEAETIDEFSSEGDQISIDIDRNSEVMIVYNCTSETGTYISANNKALYIRKAQFEKERE